MRGFLNVLRTSFLVGSLSAGSPDPYWTVLSRDTSGRPNKPEVDRHSRRPIVLIVLAFALLCANSVLIPDGRTLVGLVGATTTASFGLREAFITTYGITYAFD